MSSTLNTEQQRTLERFLDVFQQHTEEGFIFQIDGKAGVGKTELTLHIIQTLLREVLVENIVVCAPTHKACQVLRDRLSTVLKEAAVTVTTCHSFLQAQVLYDEQGKQKWVFSEEIIAPSLLIIDEVSMVEQNIYEEFMKLFHTPKSARILTLGDRCQLPPIEESESLFYRQHSVNCSLRRNMRNTKKSYNQFLQKIRDFILSPETIPRFTAQTIAEWLSEYTPTYTLQCFGINMKQIPREIWEEYSKEENAMMLAHRTNRRNNTVQQLNQQIRQYLFKQQSRCKYTVGERIIFTDYYQSTEQPDIVFHTNDRATVEHFEIQELMFYDKSFNVYALHIQTADHKEGIIYSIHEDSQQQFSNHDKHIRDNLRDEIQLLQKICKEQRCKKFCDHRKKISTNWKEYFAMKNFISAPIDYAYCLSIHKSQGSTYDKTYLFLSDFVWLLTDPNPENIRQFFKLLYVGLSRTRTKTIVF